MEKIHLFHHREIEPSHNPLRNRRGVTVTELMVVLGLIGIVALGNASFLYDFTTQLKKVTTASDSESGLSTMSIASVNILKKSAVSFNKLTLSDDSGRNFFDYYPDVPFSILQKKAKDFEKRTFTINAGDQGRYFYLIQSEESDFDSLVFDPMYAYKVVTNSSNPLLNGQISYTGLNSIPNLTGSGGTPARSGTMSQVFQSRWTSGSMFLLSCPTYLREVKNGVVDVLTPPRFASFLGKVASNDLIAAAAAETKVTFLNSNPTNNSPYSSVDNFLKTLPSVGGSAPFVKVEPVKMVRFDLRQNTRTKKYDLWFQELTQGQYKDKFLLVEDIKTVTFFRKAVSLPIISLEVQREVVPN